MRCNFMIYFELYYLHQHVSSRNVAIFIVMSLTEENNCREMCQNRSKILKKKIQLKVSLSKNNCKKYWTRLGR